MLEIYFRIADRYSHNGVTWISNKGVTGIEYDPNEIWRWRKWMRDKITNNDGQTMVVHTDQFGFRNYQKTVSKPRNVMRILVLGDSYTEALNVADDNIFESLLEKKLSSLQPMGKSIEVVSASSPGWGTDQEWVCLQNEAMKFEPDCVLLMACPNDIREAWCKKLVAPDADGQIRSKPVKFSHTEIFFWWLSNHSCVFQFLQQRIFHTDYGTFGQLRSHYTFNFGKEDTSNWDRPLFLRKAYPEVDSARALFDTLISSMQLFCDKRRIRFAVSLTPTLMEFNGIIGSDSSTRSGLVSDELAAFCRYKGVDYIDLYDRFKAESDPASCFMAPDAHFSTKGHRITAGILSDYYRGCWSDSALLKY
jgi:hypothetical protein